MKSQHATPEELTLSPDAAPDQRSAKVINEMLRAQEPISPSDCFAACVRGGGGQFQSQLEGALAPGRSFAELAALAADESLSLRAVSPVADPVTALAPPTLNAFREWSDVWRNHADKAESAALEHLAAGMLRQFDAIERSKWSMLDVDLAIHKLSAYVDRVLDVEEIGKSSTQEAPQTETPAFLLPVPWLDLSAQVELSDLTQPSPFDGDDAYDQLFLQVSRALHRRNDPHLLLVSERGVGAATVLSDVARRAAAGKIVFLYGKRFVYADCRHVPPEESRERLVALLAAVAEEPDVILCLDGFGALLTPAPHGNKAALLSLLPRFGCRLVGLISPWEHEELVAQDAEIQERFTTVEAPEPSIALATRLLRKYAAGLAAMFDVSIDDDAVDHAVNLSANYILHERLPAAHPT